MVGLDYLKGLFQPKMILWFYDSNLVCIKYYWRHINTKNVSGV